MKLPNPDQIETIKYFLAESTGLHVDGVAFNRMASGCNMTIHYRDAQGFSHRKNLQYPDARSDDDITNMVVVVSEWLSHPATTARDLAETAGSC